MLKKSLAITLGISLILTNIGIQAFAKEKTEDKLYTGACGVNTSEPVLVNEYINENGETVHHFEDNTQVIYHLDDTITIYSPFGPDHEMAPKGWIAVGKVFLKIVMGVISGCSSLDYIAGHDICREAVKYLIHPTKTEYDVDALYHAGYIPGCEPAHSGPCNAGYWEYKFY